MADALASEVYYRYEDRRYAGPCDEWGDPIPGSGHSDIHLRTYEVLKHTPKGVWLRFRYDKKFVLASANKRFACATIEEAAESFIARKKRQISIYKNRMQRAEEVLNLFYYRQERKDAKLMMGITGAWQ